MRTRNRSLQRACRPVVDSLEGRRLLSLSLPTEQAIDFGDAPDTYQTLLLSNGANHLIVPMLFMGQFIDAESNGQPSPNADLDDNSPAGLPDDEDGVTFLTPLTPGGAYTVQVINGGGMQGFVDAWIDVNNNGTFNDPVDQILQGAPAAPGVNTYNLVLSPNAVFGPTYARFRLSNFGGLPPFGPAGDGEVEDYRVFIEEGGPAVDFGDAPATYQTLLGSNGPSHPITLPAVVLGNVIDGEQDGQPSPNADQDDLTGPVDDEDGIVFLNPIVPGGNLQVQVTNGGVGINFISGWLDFNINGNFLDVADVLFIGVPVNPGVTVIPVPVPANAQLGPTYARFRLSTQPVPQPFGPAPNGEVEDYRVVIEGEVEPSDFGDAPDSYQTLLASNGPRHPLVAPIFFGATVDPEQNGQPSPNADLDDLTGVPDDEDGVVFLTPITAGSNAQVQVTLGGAIIVPMPMSAWMDFNIDGDFLDPGEQIFTNQLLNPGPNVLTFAVPANASIGPTYSRWRVSTMGNLAPFGPAPNGEVEDYRNFIEEAVLDFGDAPDLPQGFQYPTIFGGSGDPARHFIIGGAPMLGNFIDAEANGQPTVNALGDDTMGMLMDDEDGVTVLNIPLEQVPLPLGGVVPLNITNSGAAGFLNAWFDWNQSNKWDAGEQVFVNVPIPAGGVVMLNLAVPATVATHRPVYARFRISSLQGIPEFGLAPDGEVEDYAVHVVGDLDFGDAPDTPAGGFQFPTIFGGVGDPARHFAVPGAPVLGAIVDLEPNGQQSVSALGDDNSPTGVADDEDGVTVLGTPLEQVILPPGGVVPLTIVNSGSAGFLNAWFDWNLSNKWDAGEQVFVNVLLPGGGAATVLNLNVPIGLPANAAVYARFRISTLQGIPEFGFAPDGEVEDYRVRIGELEPEGDYGDAPNISLFGTGFPTLRVENGARHARTAMMPILGNLWDAEPDGQPHAQALGDDLSLILPDDEDGVLINGLPADVAQLLGGQVNQLQVFLGFIGGPTPAILSAWFDLNQDLDWNDPGEQVLFNVPLVPGVNAFQFFVPPSMGGRMVSRFRVSTIGGLGYTGFAPDGEVEDYSTQVIPDTTPPAVNVSTFEWDSRQAVSLTFSEPLNPLTVTVGDLAALNLTDGTTPVANSVILSNNNTVVTWVYNVPGSWVSDGNYRFTLAAGKVADPSGNPNTAYTLQGASIYYFGGDANRDRTVGIADFAILAANFNLPGTFSKGDFDYTGVVGIGDFAILASKFNTSLPGSLPGDAAIAQPTRPMFSADLIREEVFSENAELPW